LTIGPNRGALSSQIDHGARRLSHAAGTPFSFCKGPPPPPSLAAGNLRLSLGL
jgi:hypothetical protein